MSDLRRFEVMASLVLVAFLLVVAGGLIAVGHPRAVAGLLAGGLLGLTNMVWMVGTAKRFVGFAPTARMLQVAAAIRGPGRHLPRTRLVSIEQTSNFGGGRKLNAHFCSSGSRGRIEQRNIGSFALVTKLAAAKLPAEMQPLSKATTLSSDIIFR